MTEKQIAKLLEEYTIEDLLEESDMSPVMAVLYLIEAGYIRLPEVLPTDAELENG